MPGGYSASGSNANATPQGQQSNTVFNFNSAGTSFDGGTQSLTATPTATSTAGEGNAGGGNANNPNARNPATIAADFIQSNPVVSYIGLALLAVVAGVLIWKAVKTP